MYPSLSSLSFIPVPAICPPDRPHRSGNAAGVLNPHSHITVNFLRKQKGIIIFIPIMMPAVVRAVSPACAGALLCPISLSGHMSVLKNGVDESRTRVRKPVHRPSTIIVGSLRFPPPHGNRHPYGFGSFILRPHAQSFACVVSCMLDAWVPKCRCFRSDSRSRQAAASAKLSSAFIFRFAI